MDDQSTGELIPVMPSRDECNLAMLAHLLGIFSGFIGPLVLWLVKRDEASFVGDQANEALNFQITVALALVASVFLSIFIIGAFLFPLLLIANFVFCVLGAMSASKGKRYRYPLALRLVR
jgi:uncharacterized Tic20 family protein